MGFVLFLGCTLVAFSFPAAVFFMLVARHSQLVIVTISSAFFWLLSLIVSALLWYIVPPLQSAIWGMVPIAVVVQEVARFIFFRLYTKAEASFSVVSTNGISFPMTDFYSSIAAGLGFGGVHCVLIYGTVLTNSLGPGTLYADMCPNFSTFVVSAWLSLFFGVVHVALMILAFDAYRRANAYRVGIFLVLHMTAACSTLINLTPNGCQTAVPVVAGVALVTVGVASWVVMQPGYRSKRR